MNKKELIEYWKKEHNFPSRLIKAFSDVPREEFMAPGTKEYAYFDQAFPLMHNQTISQPSTVMIMINTLKLDKMDKVLEIGTGSGYNAAVMSKLCREVVSTEIVEELVDYAKAKIKKLGINNVKIFLTKKELGYKKLGPYDKIIVTCGATEIPQELVEQLKDGGIMIVPVGPRACQEMLVVKKQKNSLKIKDIGTFVFVPMLRD